MKTIYQQMVEAGVETSNHESDLYVPVNPVTTKLINEYKYKGNVKTFLNQITKTHWYDIPFAYDPFWEKTDRVYNR
jgi:hypothetical protein